MRRVIICSGIFSFLTILNFSCHKETLQTSAVNESNTIIKGDARSLSLCDQFVYPDTIFYPQELPTDYVVRPLNTLTGTFGAFPDGLQINKLNGKIDITESETGLRYLVWFVATGTTDTCIKYITISGINFTDSIYVLNNNPAIAAPIYNATLEAQPNCTSCEFDDGADDDDGDGILDEPTPGQEVIPQGVVLDKSNGKINLGQSISNGALGANPLPGTFKNFILNYRISDGSNKTLNKIHFRLYYFQNKSQIPAILKKTIRTKQSQVLLNKQPQGKGFPEAFYTSLQETQKVKEVKCRPPYIIIVNQ